MGYHPWFFGCLLIFGSDKAEAVQELSLHVGYLYVDICDNSWNTMWKKTKLPIS